MTNDTKTKMGRPLKFPTVEDLQTKIDNYFEATPREEWTITGLALDLDTYRDVLIDYANGKYNNEGKDYSNAIKRAKTKVENSYELSLRKNGRAGDIFGLKNFGWSDKTETDITTGGKELNLLVYKPEKYDDPDK